MKKVLSVKIDDEMARLIEDVAEREGTGKSTAARKLLRLGGKQRQLERGMESVMGGKVSAWEASQIVGVSLRKFLDALDERKIDWVKIPSAELGEELKRMMGAG